MTVIGGHAGITILPLLSQVPRPTARHSTPQHSTSRPCACVPASHTPAAQDVGGACRARVRMPTRRPITAGSLTSQVAGAKISDADRDALTKRIQFGGDEVVKAKAGSGSATLSMA